MSPATFDVFCFTGIPLQKVDPLVQRIVYKFHFHVFEGLPFYTSQKPGVLEGRPFYTNKKTGFFEGRTFYTNNKSTKNKH